MNIFCKPKVDYQESEKNDKFSFNDRIQACNMSITLVNRRNKEELIGDKSTEIRKPTVLLEISLAAEFLIVSFL